MLDSWVVGYGIEYSDGGAPQKLEALARATAAAGAQFDRLTLSAKEARAAIFDLGDVAKAASLGFGTLSDAIRATVANATSAASGVRTAAAGYTAAGAAANDAAAAIARYNVALAAGSRLPFSISANGHDPMALAGGGLGGFGGGRRGAPPNGGIPIGPGASYFGPGVPGGGGYGPPNGGGGGRGGGGGSFGAGAAGGGAFGRGTRLSLEVGAGVLVDAVHEAGELQSVLTSVQNVTGASRTQIDKLRQTSYATGHMSGTSVSESAKMFREIARNSQGSMDFDDMLGLLPQVAKMQTVLGAARGFSPEQTTDATMALVHLFRQYDPKSQPAMMDTVLRMGELMPSNLNQAVTQMGYFLPTLKNLHVSDSDAATMMVAMSRFGMGRGKGGTSLQNLAADALGPLQMTQHAQAGKSRLLGPGMLDVLDSSGRSKYFTNKGGDLFGFIDKLASFEKQHGSIDAQKVFEGAFGKQGSRIADVLADPIMIEQLHKIEDAIKNQKSLGVDSQANSIFGTQKFAEKQAWSDFQSLMTELGTATVPGVTSGFKGMSDAFSGARIWLHDNRDAEKALGDIAMTAGHAVVGLTDSVLALGGAGLKSYSEIEKAIGWLEKLNPIKPATDKTGGLTLEQQRQKLWNETHGKPMSIGPAAAGGWFQQRDALYGNVGAFFTDIIKSYQEDWKNGRAPTAWERQEQKRAVAVGPGAVVVHVDARGLDAKAVTQAVSDGAREALQRAVSDTGDPRHSGGKSTAIGSAGPRLPSRNTTPRYTGG